MVEHMTTNDNDQLNFEYDREVQNQIRGGKEVLITL
jgi:hypothetical protein